ncbi:MAG: ATP-binding cassette domain-containing protein, partial [Planctomycetota bacterium]
MLDVQGIEVFYGETQAVFGASLNVGNGEIVSLLGPNGAGKTTTIRSIMGLTSARRGRIQFDGKDVTHD